MHKSKKLALSRETLRNLAAPRVDLRQAAAGATLVISCFSACVTNCVACNPTDPQNCSGRDNC